MPKALPRKVLVEYTGTKNEEENVVAGPDAKGRIEPMTWTPGRQQFVTLAQAGRLLFYATLYKDARTEDDKRKYGPIPIIPPQDARYQDATAEEVEAGRDGLPLIDVKTLDARGLVYFAGQYLNKKLDVDEPREKLLEEVQRGIEGLRFEFA